MTRPRTALPLAFASALVLLLGLLAAPAGAASTLVPWADSGYRYQQVPYDTAPAGFEQPGFDDASWSTGPAAFGLYGPCPGLPFVRTHWAADTEMLLRKHVNVPAGARGIVVHGAIDNKIQVWFNGHDITGGLIDHGFCAFRDNVGPWSVPDEFVHDGDNVLAVRAVDYGDQGDSAYVDVSVEATQAPPAPVVAGVRGSIAFGPHLVGRTTSNGGLVTIGNEGNAALHVSALTLAGDNPHQFAVSDDGCTGVAVDPGQHCRFRVHYAPTVTGDVSARVRIDADDPESPHIVALTGTGVSEPRVRVRSAVDFPDTAVGTRSARGYVVVRNTGSEPLHITGLSLGGADPGEFALRDKTCLAAPVAPGARCSFKTRFAPTAPGPHAATADIADDAPGAPQHVALSGTGT